MLIPGIQIQIWLTWAPHISLSLVGRCVKEDSCTCSVLNAVVEVLCCGQSDVWYGLQACRGLSMEVCWLSTVQFLVIRQNFADSKTLSCQRPRVECIFYPNSEFEIQQSQKFSFHDYNLLRYEFAVPGSHMVDLLISWVEVDCKTLQSLLCHILQVFCRLQAHGMLFTLVYLNALWIALINFE